MYKLTINIKKLHRVIIFFWFQDDGWGQKVRDRKGQGTGRMRYMKTIARRAKNGFRSGTTAQPRVKAAATK